MNPRNLNQYGSDNQQIGVVQTKLFVFTCLRLVLYLFIRKSKMVLMSTKQVADGRASPTENKTHCMPTFRSIHPLSGVLPLFTHGTLEYTHVFGAN